MLVPEKELHLIIVCMCLAGKSYTTYQFYATYDGSVSDLNDCRSISGANRVHIDNDRTKLAQISAIRSQIEVQVVTIIFDRMDNSNEQ